MRSRREVTLDGNERAPDADRVPLALAARAQRRQGADAPADPEEVWGPAHAHQTHHLRVHMAELRKKVERDPARPRLLVTEPGVGYRLRDQASDA